MSLAFNESGLVTLGMGPNHKLCTIGMSVRFDFGGIRFRRELKEYILNLIAPILKEDYGEIGIYSPLEIRKDRRISINLGVSKEVEEDMNLLSSIDHSKLSEILDAI